MAGTTSDTIVNQAVILADGWRVVGWILTLRDGQLRMVAYRPTPSDDEYKPGVRSSVALRSLSKAEIRKTYTLYRAAVFSEGTGPPADFIDELKLFTVSPCFGLGLPRGA